MKVAFTLVFSFLCAGLTVSGETLQEQKLEIWHKVEKQDEYLKRGEIIYTLNPQTVEYVEDASSFQLQPSGNSLYNVKVNSVSDGSNSIALSSAKWCMLKSSQFSDKFTLHFDKEGNFFHIDYHPGAHSCVEDSQVSEVKFNTSIELVKPYYELRPKLQRITEEELKKKENSEYSNFFTKYWYIILPIVLVLLVGGGDPPKEGEGDGGR
ncbi:hypothetical protein K7432_003835 [Basidiobolus ranarum]|uniref:ER membrane protein complex subunit 10 n=1 Tax=Basidiobolus ranarum TaxID=34480 RepID=A0ABR2W600_9FUNG